MASSELNRMFGKLAAGGVVTVTRINRLGRSTFDLFGIVKRIVGAKRNSGRWPLKTKFAKTTLHGLQPSANVAWKALRAKPRRSAIRT